MDSLDKIIQTCRAALHEGRRQRAVHRRHARDNQAEARLKLDQLEDRIAFHTPLREREVTETVDAYARYVMRVKLHRHQLLLMAVAATPEHEEQDDWDPGKPFCD
ncbi:MAG: hypothetical protein ACRD3L_10915 [Terriglobales bacterium]